LYLFWLLIRLGDRSSVLLFLILAEIISLIAEFIVPLTFAQCLLADDFRLGVDAFDIVAFVAPLFDDTVITGTLRYDGVRGVFVLANQIAKIRRQVKIQGILARLAFNDVDLVSVFVCQLLEQRKIQALRVFRDADVQFKLSILIVQQGGPGRTDVFTVDQDRGYFRK